MVRQMRGVEMRNKGDKVREVKGERGGRKGEDRGMGRGKG